MQAVVSLTVMATIPSLIGSILLLFDTLSGDIPQSQEALKAACQTFQLFNEILDQALTQRHTMTP